LKDVAAAITAPVFVTSVGQICVPVIKGKANAPFLPISFVTFQLTALRWRRVKERHTQGFAN